MKQVLNKKNVKDIVKKSYSKVAKRKNSCCCNKKNKDIANKIGYTDKEIKNFSEANLGLGCGNPLAFSNIKEGDVVLDLGSGAGFDSFIAAKKIGGSGKVIGVDMTEEMVEKAKKLAEKYDFKNVEFRLGDIENLPCEDESIDIIISNCVINLASDKKSVFKDAYRVLKQNGRMFVSDIVLLEDLTEKQRNDPELISGCVGGALLKDDYLNIIEDSGFKYKILDEDKEISKSQYRGFNLESLKLELFK